MKPSPSAGHDPIVTCPACGVAQPLREGECARCAGRVLPPGALDDLAARALLEPDALREIVAAASPSEFVCGPCQKPMRHVSLRGATVGICARCGATFLPAVSADRLLGGGDGEPRRREPRRGPPPAMVAPYARVRWALTPFAGITAASVSEGFLRSSPLSVLDTSSFYACLAVLTPIAVALAVRLVAPARKNSAAAIAVLVSCVAVVAITHARTALALANAVGVIVGGLGALSLTSSLGATRRVIAGVAFGTAVIVGSAWAYRTAEARASEGCPDGARWVERAGRHCALADGTRHGDGELRGTKDVLLERGTWSKGRRSGAFIFFHANSNKRGEGSFIDDAEEGPWLFFREDGTIAESGRYVRGQRQGPWATYDARGERQAVHTYVNDRLVP